MERVNPYHLTKAAFRDPAGFAIETVTMEERRKSMGSRAIKTPKQPEALEAYLKRRPSIAIVDELLADERAINRWATKETIVFDASTHQKTTPRSVKSLSDECLSDVLHRLLSAKTAGRITTKQEYQKLTSPFRDEYSERLKRKVEKRKAKKEAKERKKRKKLWE